MVVSRVACFLLIIVKARIAYPLEGSITNWVRSNALSEMCTVHAEERHREVRVVRMKRVDTNLQLLTVVAFIEGRQ